MPAQKSNIFWPVFLGVTILNLVWWLYLQVLTDHTTNWNFLFNIVYGLPYLLAGGCLLWQAALWRRERYPDTVAFVFFGIGMLIYGAAQLAWAYYNLYFEVEIPYPSVSDYFYISSPILQIFGLLVLLFHRMHPSAWPRAVSWTLIGFAVIGSFGVAELLFQLSGGEETLFSLDAYYTVTSLIAAFLVLVNLHREWHVELRRFLTILFLAEVVGGFGNFLFAVRVNAEQYWNGDLADGLFALSGILFFLAAGHLLPKKLAHISEEISSSVFGRLDLILPGCLMIIGVLIASQGAELVFRDGTSNLRRQTDLQSQQLAELIQQGFDQQSAGLNAFLGFFEGSETVTSEEFVVFTERLHSEGVGPINFAYMDTRGTIQLSSNPVWIGTSYLTDTVRTELFRRANEVNGLVVSPPMILLSGGDVGVVMMKRVEKDGVVAGVLTGAIDLPQALDGVQELFADEISWELRTSDRYISQDGSVIYDSAGRRFVDPYGAVESGTAYAFAPESEISVEHVIDVGGQVWILTVSPQKLALEELYVFALSIFLSITLVMVAFAMIVYLILSQQSRLRTDLARKTHDLEEKIRELSLSKYYLDNVSDLVVASGEDHKVVYANRAVDALTEGRVGVMGRDRFAFLAEEPAQAEVEAALKRNGRWEGEVVYRRKTSGVGDLLLTIRTLQNEAGERTGTLLVGRDITDRKNVERAKTQFVSLVSHQLRAPMTQLRWIVEQLMDESRLSRSAKQHLKLMEEIIIAENKLVGDLLNVSRIERGVLKINLDEVKLTRVLGDAVRPLEKAAADRRITLVIASNIPASAIVKTDPEKLAEAIRNIVDNSVKYSPEGGRVELSVEKMRGRWVIKIVDQGPGIPEEVWDTLFEIKTTPSSSPGTGAGLGLYLSKRFIEAVGGEVAFQTSSNGTMFTVSLPATKSSKGQGGR